MEDQTTPSTAKPSIRVLGHMLIQRRAGEPAEPVPPSSAIMLAALVATRGCGISNEDLSRLYWRAARPDYWAGVLNLYEHWLTDRLPDGSLIHHDGTKRWLTAPAGSVDAWSVLDAEEGARVPEQWSLEPYPGLERAGVIARSVQEIEQQQTRLSFGRRPSSTTGLGRIARACSHHPSVFQDLETALVGCASVVTTVRGADDEVDSFRRHLFRTAHAADTIAVGGQGPDLDFGDMAMATSKLRWPVLSIEGPTTQARVARAWRLVRDRVQERSYDRPRRLFVFDANRLDSASMDLLATLAKFPIGIQWFVFGDRLDQDERWQRLRRSLEDEASAVVERCVSCKRWVVETGVVAGEQADA